MSLLEDLVEDMNEVEDQQVYDTSKPRIQGSLYQKEKAGTVQFEEEFIGEDISEIVQDNEQQNNLKIDDNILDNQKENNQNQQYKKKRSLNKQISEYNIDEDLESISKNSLQQDEGIKEEDYEEEILGESDEGNQKLLKQKTNFLNEDIQSLHSQQENEELNKQEKKQQNFIQKQEKQRTPEEEAIYQKELQKQRNLIKIENDPLNLEFFKKIKKNEIIEGLDLMATRNENDQNYKQLEIEYIVKQLNRISNSFMNQKKYTSVKLLLDFCKDELEFYKNYECYPKLISLTYNNLGCLYRRLKKLDQGMQYLEQAFKVQAEKNQLTHVGVTFLNMGAIYSQQGNHEKAIQFAQKAVNKCNQQYQNMGNTGKSLDELKKDLDFLDLARNLSVGFFNLGMEMEYFENYSQAIQNYENSKQVAIENLGEQNKFTQKIVKISSEKSKQLYELQKQKFLKKQRNIFESPKQQQKKSKQNQNSENIIKVQKENNHACVGYTTTTISREKIDQYAKSYQIQKQNFLKKGKQIYLKPESKLKTNKLQSNPPHPLLRNVQQSSSNQNLKHSKNNNYNGMSHQTLTQFLSTKKSQLQNISLQVTEIEVPSKQQQQNSQQNLETFKICPSQKYFAESRSVSNQKKQNNYMEQSSQNFSQSSKYQNSRYQKNILNDGSSISSFRNQSYKSPYSQKQNQNSIPYKNQIKVIQRPQSAKTYVSSKQENNNQNSLNKNHNQIDQQNNCQKQMQNNSVDNGQNNVNKLKNYNVNNNNFIDEAVLYEEQSQEDQQSNSKSQNKIQQEFKTDKKIIWNENFTASSQILKVQPQTRKKCKPYILEIANQLPSPFISQLQTLKQQQEQEKQIQQQQNHNKDFKQNNKSYNQGNINNISSNSQQLNKTHSIKKYKMIYHKSPRKKNNFI